MPGSFDLDYLPASVAGQALPIVVARYTPDGLGRGYALLPNIRCLQIDYREGPEPPSARFLYLTGDLLEANLGWPSQFEALWPIDAAGAFNVLVDDRLVVLTSDPDGDLIVLFDGFAQIPQIDVGPQSQHVSFVAVGVAARLWDNPIVGRFQRNADQPDTTDGSEDIGIDGSARFNPSNTSIGSQGGFIGNSVGFGYYTIGDAGSYPVFIDPQVAERDPDYTDFWDIGGALKYFQFALDNPVDGAGNPYVTFPSFATIDALSEAFAAPGDGILTAGDAMTSHINIRDYDATNKAIPQVYSDLLTYAGIIMVFETSTGVDGTPYTELKILRRDAFGVSDPKNLYLAADGATTLDLAANNSTQLHLARDTNCIANGWTMETSLNQVEVTIYLAPGFTPVSGDEVDCSPFYACNLSNSTGGQQRKYRWYIADECGDGHWNATTATFEETTLDLSPVFPPDPNTGNPTYVRRYRPGSRTLIAKDAEGKPLKAVLEIKQGLIGDDPAVSLKVGTGWLTVPHGWEMLDDRLGIAVYIEDPESWHTGNPALPTIQGVTWNSNPPAGNTFVLRLTTVIEADVMLDAEAPKRPASPTQFARFRSGDGKDHFQYCAIAVGSLNYEAAGGDGTNPVVIRDDTAAATTHAVALRSAHEMPTLAGSVTIPFLTDYYQIGDRIKLIEGRDVNLGTNVGLGQGELPTYPWVTAFSWQLEHDAQRTTLQLSDRRAEPQGV